MSLSDFIARSTLLELAQGFGLVAPDPFSSREQGGVWAQDYKEEKALEISIRYTGGGNLIS